MYIRRVCEHRFQIVNMSLQSLALSPIGPVDNDVVGMTLLEPVPFFLSQHIKVESIETSEVLMHVPLMFPKLRHPSILAKARGSEHRNARKRSGCHESSVPDCVSHSETCASFVYDLRNMISRRSTARFQSNLSRPRDDLFSARLVEPETLEAVIKRNR